MTVLIEDLLPLNGKPGGQWNDRRTALNGILWILHTGDRWRELPERQGKWSLIPRFDRWTSPSGPSAIPVLGPEPGRPDPSAGDRRHRASAPLRIAEGNMS